MNDTLKLSAQTDTTPNCFMAAEPPESNFVLVRELPEAYKIIKSETAKSQVSVGKPITATHIKQALRAFDEKPGGTTDMGVTPQRRKTSHVPLGNFLEWLKMIKDRVRSGQTMEALRLLTRAEAMESISLPPPEEANQTA